MNFCRTECKGSDRLTDKSALDPTRPAVSIVASPWRMCSMVFRLLSVTGLSWQVRITHRDMPPSRFWVNDQNCNFRCCTYNRVHINEARQQDANKMARLGFYFMLCSWVWEQGAYWKQHILSWVLLSAFMSILCKGFDVAYYPPKITVNISSVSSCLLACSWLYAAWPKIYRNIILGERAGKLLSIISYIVFGHPGHLAFFSNML